MYVMFTAVTIRLIEDKKHKACKMVDLLHARITVSVLMMVSIFVPWSEQSIYVVSSTEYLLVLLLNYCEIVSGAPYSHDRSLCLCRTPPNGCQVFVT